MGQLQQSDFKQAEVRKHVGAIQINGRLSLLQRKLSNVLLWNAYDGLLEKDTHRIRIRELAYLAGFDSNDVQVLKTALRDLVDIKLEWNMLHEDGDKEWGIASMLASASIRGGYCSYAYAPNLRDKFYNPEMYARINIGIQRNITTGYALTLYENCIRYRNVGSTGWIELEVLRKLFGVEDKKYYRTFKFFNNKIIKPAVEGINEASDIHVAAEYQREKRRIVAVRFKIKDNPQSSLFDKARREAEAEELPAPPKGSDALQQDLIERLKGFGVSPKTATRLVTAHEREYLEAKFTLVEKNFQAGKVKDLPGYAIAAIEQDYQAGKTPYVVDREKAKAEKRAREEEKLRQQQAQEKEQEKAQHEADVARILQAVGQLDEREQKKLEARFHQAHKNQAGYIRWHKEGLEHPLMQGLFTAFAKRELLEGQDQQQAA
jgi:hypothetical protein